MIFKCLGSSSKGNGYLLTSSKGETLIIECGVSVKEVKKALNFDLSGVVGALASHCHLDHIGRIKEYCTAGIDIYTESVNISTIKIQSHRIKGIFKRCIFNLGGFKVMGFSVEHDIPCLGYLIEHSEMGRMVFITDTKYVGFNFPNLNHIMVESNYSIDIMNERLISGSLDGYLRNRVMESHLEFGTAKEFILSNDLSQVRTICLLHLSDGNSDAARFKRETEELTGKPTFIADTRTEIDLSLNPF